MNTEVKAKNKPDVETIGEFILRNELLEYTKRLNKLKKLPGTTELMMRNALRDVDNLAHGRIRIGGKKGLLTLPVGQHQKMTGKKGRQFIVFNGGAVVYFPQAAYGRFITSGR